MSYDRAPAAQIMHQRCLVCGRILLDVLSVEVGIGPTCRKKVGLPPHKVGQLPTWESPARERCNRLIYEATQVVLSKDFDALSPILKDIRSNGYERLAQVVAERYYPISIIEETTDEGVILVLKAPFVGTKFGLFLREGCDGVVWLKRRKRYLIPKQGRRVLWAALLKFHEGQLASGPKGIFRVA